MNEYINTAMKLRRWVVIGHHIPGRIRLKYKLGILSQLAAFKTDAIENTLGAIPAFKNYKLNSATSSIVVEYDATLIDPTWVDAFFSDSSDAAEQACISIANSINVNGVNQ